MNSNVEPIRTPAPHRRLVTVVNLHHDREVVFVEVHFPELLDTLLASMIGDLVYSAAAGNQHAEQYERVSISFTEEVNDKEIPIGPPAGLLDLLYQKLEEEINPTLVKLNMEMGVVAASSYLEITLRIIDEAPAEQEELDI